MKTLVIYFSAEGGKTAKVAKDYAASIGADVYEIVPEKIYTKADLNWKNPLSRCNREFFGKKEVPAAGEVENFADYDTVYIGFPIWYGVAPLVVSTFCGKYDWTGKTVHVFATSGGSGIGKTAEKLAPFIRGSEIADAKRVTEASEI